MKIRARFAPSPTGHLHIGGLRTALFNELFVRRHNGTLLLRIEDTDHERSEQKYVDSIIHALEWAGISFDEKPVIQSDRIAEHKKVLQALIKEGKAYYCYCTQEEVIERNKRSHGQDYVYGNAYDRYCLNNYREKKNGNPAIRFKLPFDSGSIRFTDLIRGELVFNADQLDDFIIARSDGTPMYNFVVIVDDNFMKISHVIRGDDHISNTPKQILLYQACGYPVPLFAHLPMILGPSGDRLSKRDAATSVLDYQKNGYLPEALINYLVRLGWSYGDQEKLSKQEMIEHFALENVNTHGARFDQEKLDWLNGVYIRETSSKELLAIIEKNIEPQFVHVSKFSELQLQKLIELYKERVKTVAEIMHAVLGISKAPEQFDPEALKKWIVHGTAEHIQQIISALKLLEPCTAEAIAQAIKNVAHNKNVKLVSLAQPIRIALLGTDSGPGVFELIEIIGNQETISRLQKLHAVIS